MKYIMVAKTFPAYHPRKGEPTGFRDSILSGDKQHTIRGGHGNRFDGDTVSLRQWESRPYASKQQEFAKCEIVVKPIRVFGTVEDAHIQELGRTDGLGAYDFAYWFTEGKKLKIDFTGYIIHFLNVRAT
jgi:hypothetical protein